MIYSYQIEKPAIYCAACGEHLGFGLASASGHFCDFIPSYKHVEESELTEDTKI